MFYKKPITLSLMAVAMMLGFLCTKPCEAVFSEILYGVESGTDGLSVYDPVTGAATFVGELDGDPLVNNFSTPIAMAVRPSDGTIFVWNNSSKSPTGSGHDLTYELLTVDPATGLATEVDPLALPQGQLGALVFTPDDRLFGMNHSSPYTLVEINPVTGEFVSGSSVSLGLGIAAADSDPCGVIYGVELTGSSIHERFVTIDPTTGVVTDIGNLNPEVGVIGTIVFDPDGNLIGSSFGGSLGSVLFDIDVATGAVSNIRSTGTASQGLGFVFAYSQEDTPEGPDVVVRLYDRRKKAKKKAIRVKFKEVTKQGKTTFKKKKAKKKAKLPLLQFAVCSPSDVIEIETTAEFIPPVEVCVDYTDITCDGSDLRLFHKTEDGGWEDVTTCIDEVGTPEICGDPDTLDVCGEVEDLSDFAVLVKKGDRDEDGLTDEDEDFYGTDPDNPDTDDDGLLDGTEVEIAEGSGCPDPLDPDSDGDTLTDGDEVLNIGTNPCSSDSDEDGVPDNIDPNPLEAGEVSDELEAAVRNLASLIADLDPGLFSGPNYNANKGRRNSLATRVRNAANAISKDDFSSAIDLLTGVLEKIDGEEPSRDWMGESPQKTTTAAFVSQLIGLLTL